MLRQTKTAPATTTPKIAVPIRKRLGPGSTAVTHLFFIQSDRDYRLHRAFESNHGIRPIIVCLFCEAAKEESSAGRIRTARLAVSGGLGQFDGVLDERDAGIEVEFGLKLLAVTLDGFD